MFLWELCLFLSNTVSTGHIGDGAIKRLLDSVITSGIWLSLENYNCSARPLEVVPEALTPPALRPRDRAAASDGPADCASSWLAALPGRAGGFRAREPALPPRVSPLPLCVCAASA